MCGLLACDPGTTDGMDQRVNVASIGFDDPSELSNWNLGSSEGEASLDTAVKFQGAASLHFSPTGCYHADRQTGIPVKKGRRYSLSFHVKMEPVGVGSQVFCAAQFMVMVKQGNEELLREAPFDAPDWELKTYYFEAQNDLPVNLSLMAGAQTWLDNIVMVRELD
ncbi:MAG: hypothetical protein K0Q91_1024 [Fibrobacteria bacterium]|jgi:hypothetical protein|nr:hypothetical protein [Fibrobacteria bacterium]